jgi:uncharacterized membrane protein
MRAAVAAGLLLAACGQAPDSPGGDARHPDDSAEAVKWRIERDGDSPELVLASGPAPRIRIICSPARQQLSVNVPNFEPIGSEERLSFGQGGEVVALVADVRGDTARGGVTGSSPLPDNLAQLLAGPVSASYGAQTSGPHPEPASALVSEFTRACSGKPTNSPSAGPERPGASACLRSRDGEPVPANAIRGIGTEPFWAVSVEGRCVTYSHPEDQSGTRVWTNFTGTASSGTWTGSLGGQPFVMKTRPQPGCSDGMSDEIYPIAVSLTVGGEQRSGCAEPR